MDKVKLVRWSIKASQELLLEHNDQISSRSVFCAMYGCCSWTSLVTLLHIIVYDVMTIDLL